MRKVLFVSFLLCIGALFSFSYVVFFYHLPALSIQKNVYEKRIENFSKIFAETLVQIESDMYEAVEPAAIKNYFIDLSKGLPIAEKLSVRYGLLETIAVLDEQGKPIYTFGEPTDFDQSLYFFSGNYFLLNQEHIGLKLDIRNQENGEQATMLFHFSLRKLMSTLYSRILTDFKESNIFVYRFAYIYNELGLLKSSKVFVSLEKLIDSSYEESNKIIKSNTQSVAGLRQLSAKQLQEGITIGFYHSRKLLGIPVLSLSILFVLLLCFFLLGMLLFIYREQKKIEIQKFVFLKTFLFRASRVNLAQALLPASLARPATPLTKKKEALFAFFRKSMLGKKQTAALEPASPNGAIPPRLEKKKVSRKKGKLAISADAGRAGRAKGSPSRLIGKPFPVSEFPQLAEKISSSKKLLQSKERLELLEKICGFPLSIGIVLQAPHSRQAPHSSLVFSAVEYFGISYKSSQKFSFTEKDALLQRLLLGKPELLISGSSKVTQSKMYAKERRKISHVALVPLKPKFKKTVKTIVVFGLSF